MWALPGLYQYLPGFSQTQVHIHCYELMLAAPTPIPTGGTQLLAQTVCVMTAHLLSTVGIPSAGLVCCMFTFCSFSNTEILMWENFESQGIYLELTSASQNQDTEMIYKI